MAARQSDTRTVKLSLRIGSDVAPSGQVGSVAAYGDVPDGEFVQWLERLTFQDLPRSVGAIAFYIDGRRLVGHDQVAAPTATSSGGEIVRTATIEAAERRLATVLEQVRAEQDRLRQVREDLTSLAAHLDRERARVTTEVTNLEQHLAAHRQQCQAERSALTANLAADTAAIAETMARATDSMRVQLETVATVLNGTLVQVANTNNHLITEASDAAKAAHERKVESQKLTLNTLALHNELEEAGAKQLLSHGGPSPKDKLYEGVGTWVGNGGVERTLGFFGSLAEKLLLDKPK